MPASRASEYPYRYGDLFKAPTADAFGRDLISTGKKPAPWMGVLVLSPSCELVTKAGDDDPVTVARVRDLSRQSASQRAQVSAGWKDTPDGPSVAFASFAYLAPVPWVEGFTDQMYADFRQIAVVRYGDLKSAGRVAALDHEARVALIRRELYYRYRWLVPMDSVRNSEAVRIRADAAFIGPKPEWASGR
ncbi:MAG: hypothetical protein GC156_15440 [Actinomycetales bacterium]|nr:hypothetical protein [Actinomycetales bacterium]